MYPKSPYDRKNYGLLFVTNFHFINIYVSAQDVMVYGVRHQDTLSLQIYTEICREVSLTKEEAMDCFDELVEETKKRDKDIAEKSG